MCMCVFGERKKLTHAVKEVDMYEYLQSKAEYSEDLMCQFVPRQKEFSVTQPHHSILTSKVLDVVHPD